MWNVEIVGSVLLAFCVVLAAGKVESGRDAAVNSTEEMPSFRTGRRTTAANSCQTVEGFTGSCLTRFNCMRQGGAVSGFCGTYGVCCETNLQCGLSSKQKTIVIKNPITLPTECTYVIEPYSPNVCQLRIDFEKFSLQQPTLNGQSLTCTDQLSINQMTICGNNDGQHIYVPFNVAGGMDHVRLMFDLSTRWSSSNWRLVLTQLECPMPKKRSTSFGGNPLGGGNALLPFMNQNGLNDIRNIFSTHNSDLDILAPPGCLQYHTARQGTIQSFNYNNGLGLYLGDMSYAICFKRTFSDMMLQLNALNFGLSQQIITNPGYDNDCHSNVLTANRREDYLMIPRAMFVPQMDIQPTYFCGATSIAKNQIIYSNTEGPFVVYFNSDAITDTTEIGFQFNYKIQ